jgi:DUF177 domain-containing protein
MRAVSGGMGLDKQELAPSGGPTYDTRPMPEDGAKPVSVAVLADTSRRVELVVPVQRMKRIAEHLTSPEGEVTGSVEFSRDEGRIVAEVQLATRLALRCQRCLQPLPVPIESRSRVVLVTDEAAAAGVPPELETALAPEGRLPLADLVEEELLLALPAAPRHAGACPGGERGVAMETEAQPTQRPFAGLGELLGRSKQ